MPARQRRTLRYDEEQTAAETVQPEQQDDAQEQPEEKASPEASGEQPAGADGAYAAYQPSAVPRSLLATNTGVRLACTMAAMMGLFALFLCWAEKESRVIRRFAVQSAALTAGHAIVAASALILTALLGGIPFLGVLITLFCWLCYIAVLVLLIVARVRLMEKAWQGVRYDLPPFAERLIARYY